MSNAKSAAAVPTPAPAKRKGGHVSWRTLEALKGASFTWPFLAGFIFFVIIPVVMALQVSLYSKQKSGLGLGEATTKFVGLQNILNAMTRPSGPAWGAWRCTPSSWCRSLRSCRWPSRC